MSRKRNVILFLAANPDGASQLTLDQEIAADRPVERIGLAAPGPWAAAANRGPSGNSSRPVIRNASPGSRPLQEPGDRVDRAVPARVQHRGLQQISTS